MCRRFKCQYAISSNGNVVGCGFYPTLKDLPNDCQVPEILDSITSGEEEIIELTEEVIIK